MSDLTLFPGWEPEQRIPRPSEAATDVRAWWPACPDYSPGDSLSHDAARYIPEVAES